MKLLMSFWYFLTEKVAVCVLLVAILPTLLLAGLLVHLLGGEPVVVTDELAGLSGRPGRRVYRFRTTGHGGAHFHAVGRVLRKFSIDEMPALWSVVKGDIRLRELRMLAYERRVR